MLWGQALCLGCGTTVIKGLPWSWKVTSEKCHFKHWLKGRTSPQNVQCTKPLASTILTLEGAVLL